MDGRTLGIAALVVAGLMIANQGDAPSAEIDGPMPDELPPDEGGEGMGYLSSGRGAGAAGSTSPQLYFRFWATRNAWRRDSRGRLIRIGDDGALQRQLRPEYAGAGRRINAMMSGQGRQGSTTETLHIQGWANVAGVRGNQYNWLASQLLSMIRSSGIQITRYGFN